MTPSHPALEYEQAYVDRAYELLDKGLADAEHGITRHGALDRNTGRAMKRALEVLRASRGTGQLVFGRVDIDDEPVYIGRRRVYDEQRDLKVIGWHAPAAVPYYEATPQRPGRVQLKRVFDEENRRLKRIVDEIASSGEVVTSGDDGSAAVGHVRYVSDALLSELERTRDGAMREVVSTIQAEQFRIIRAARDTPIIVQGGPGTGKTVVGLHRAAWLAFNYEELRHQGILVVVPSNTFLSYVAGVLPSLEVTDVHQIEIAALYSGEARVRGIDSPLAARVKGSAEMALVLRQAVEQRIGNVDGDLVLPIGAERIIVPADVLRQIVTEARRRSAPYNDRRDLVRQQLAVRAYEIHVETQRAANRPTLTTEATIRRLTAFANALDRIWPSFSPEELLRSLYASQSRLGYAAQDVLAPDDRAALYRPQAERIESEPWTAADLHCLDELADMLNGPPRTYGHIVVDEAQDLSPMAARAIGRRCPSGSMTILGDLAQATGSWTRDAWVELSPHLSDRTAEVAELTIGYRVPAEVTELATRQLEFAAIDVSAPLSVRRGSGRVEVVPLTAIGDAVSYAANLSERALKVALIVADDMYDGMAADAQAAGFGDGRDADFTQPVTLLPISSCKGLEFDAIVLVEPASLVADLPHGPRWLYVAMTRCTQELHILHAAPLPAGLEHLDRRTDATESAEGAVTGVSETRRELAELLATLDDSDVALVARVIRRLASDQGSVQPGKNAERRGGAT